MLLLSTSAVSFVRCRHVGYSFSATHCRQDGARVKARERGYKKQTRGPRRHIVEMYAFTIIEFNIYTQLMAISSDYEYEL